ncbi:MAG: hypothetical protein G01um10145_458 [Microgenomates group bacterium Gr01-1014_5]|nr:MAG: hypothetical protein G01um10145_458 [Microgenomates group bacterium Gr01-1014_5]
MPEVAETLTASQSELIKPSEPPKEYPFQRREGVDEEGRAIYAYEFTTKQGQKVEAIFFSRGEPTSGGDLVKDRLVVPVGSLKTREGQEKVPQAARIIKSEQTSGSSGPEYQKALNDGKATFLVESSPQGLLDLYFHLGGNDSQIREARKLTVVNWKFTPQVRDLIDRVVAGNIVDTNGVAANKENKREGEVLAVLLLIGDEAAKTLSSEKLAQLEKHDQERDAQANEKLLEHSKNFPVTQEALKVEELVCVHLTRFKPVMNPETGRYEIRSTFDSTRGLSPRTTLHFSMNHPVVSHMYGSWEGAGYAVIIPFKSALEANGKPTQLNTVDSFWELPVGGSFEMPEGSVFVEGGKTQSLQGEELQEERITRIKYDQSLSPVTINQLFERVKDDKSSFVQYMKREIGDGLFDRIRYQKGLEVYDTKNNALWESIWNLWEGIDLQEYFKNHTIQDLASEAYSLFPAGVVSATEFNNGLQSIREVLASKVRDVAVVDTLKRLGFRIHTGGMWAWDRDSWEATWQTVKLAIELGTRSGNHTDHPTNRAEDHGIRYMYSNGYSMGGQTYSKEEVRSIEKSFIWGNMDQYSQNQRRALYLCGII